MTTETTETTDFLAADFPRTDAEGAVFDPELHAKKPDGSPALKTDGTFRKKRRDAGSASRATRTRTTSSRPKAAASGGGSPSASKLLAEQRARHIKGVQTVAAGVLTPLAFFSPVDAYTLQDLVPSFAEAVADYAPENPQVAAALDKLSTGGGLFTVLAIVGVGALQVMHNHGRIREDHARIIGLKPLSETRKIMEQRSRAMAEGVPDAA